MYGLINIIEQIFGHDPDLLTMWQMVARSFVVYLLGIFFLRIHSRFMNMRTTNNFFLYILLGSILASTIVGVIDFLQSIGTVIIIMTLNILTNIAIFYSPILEKIIRGKPTILIDNGKINRKALKRNFITYNELMEAVHRANIDNLDDIKKAYFESNGRITVIWK